MTSETEKTALLMEICIAYVSDADYASFVVC